MSETNIASNYVVWCDIPVADLKRACEFYHRVLDVDIEIMSFEGNDLAVFYHDKGNGACLMPQENAISAEHGVLIYLNVNGRIEDALDQVEEYGGTVIEEVQALGEYGYRAVILDSEGNKMALHSE
ncbi:VOC family protein [Thiotrichales bacterium 19X7-9]|nr:VOC family protein [Thiotrichales bacterium 19X7-9]